MSHEAFQAALRSLANHYTGHLEKTEEQRVAIRGHHAPRLARLALETTSIADMVRYGKYFSLHLQHLYYMSS